MDQPLRHGLHPVRTSSLYLVMEAGYMRSFHWEYLASVLFAFGFALTLSGSITYVYYKQRPLVNTQYDEYPIPMMIVGVSAIFMGTLAILRLRTRKTEETTLDGLFPPPPPPPPSSP